MNKQLSTQHVQAGLSVLYRTSEPDTVFADSLERQFKGRRAGTAPARYMRRPRLRFLPNWVTAVVLILLLTSVSVLAIGPQRVWAEVLGLISFIPGVGIAEIESTRLMLEPVTVRQEKVEFTVDSVAVTDRTVIKYSIRTLILNVPDPRELPLDMNGISFYLELPDGSTLQPDDLGWMPRGISSYELESVLIFPQLPMGITSATLVVDVDQDVAVLPIDPAGVRVNLLLIHAADDSLIEKYPEPQVLDRISDTKHGITLQLNKAYYVDGQIALDVSLLNDSSPWLLRGAMLQSLLDATTQKYYWKVYDLGIGATESYYDPEHRVDTIYAYEPGLRQDASTLSFSLENVVVYTDTIPLSWEIDTLLPITLYKTVPMDIDFEIAGFPYQIVGVRWVERPESNPAPSTNPSVLWWYAQEQETEYLLVIDVMVPSQGDGILEPFSLLLESDHTLYTTSTGHGFVRGSDMYHYVFSLGFSELPEDAVTVTVKQAFFIIKDTWNLEWDVVQPE